MIVRLLNIGQLYRFEFIIQNNTNTRNPGKATSLIVVTCSAIWYEAQQ